MQEVEDIHRQNTTHLWEKYKWYVVGVSVILVVAIGAVAGYNMYQSSVSKEHVRTYENVFKAAKVVDEKTLRALAFDGRRGVRFLSALHYARFLQDAGKTQQAADILITYSNSTAPSIYTRYADLASIWMRMEDGYSPKLLGELNAIIDSSAFTVTSLFTQVEILLSVNKNTEAMQALMTIIYLESATPDQKDMAKKLLDILENS